MNRLATSSALLLSTLAHVSLTCLSTGLSAETLLAVATGISGSIVTDMIKGLSRDKIKHLLFGTHPSNLNHSIKKLFVSSLEQALDNIFILYGESGITKQEKKDAKKAIDVLKKTLLKKSSSELTETILNDRNTSAFIRSEYSNDKVTLFLQQELQSSGLETKLTDFIAKHFPSQVQLCFGEGLKSPEHRNAWIAYQRLMSEELREMIRGLETGQKEIIQELKNIKLTQGLDPSHLEELRKFNNLLSDENKFSLALNDALAQSLVRIEKLADQLIKITTETNYTVREIRSLQEQQIKRTKRLQYLVALILVVALLAASALATTLLHAPFNVSIIVHGWLGKNHAPLRDLGSITLTIKGKSYRGEIDSQGQVLLADLPYECSGELGRVRIDDTEGMPYYCCDSTVIIKKGETIYLPISISGIDRASGVIKDEITQIPISGATIRIAGIEVHSNNRGEFNLSIPQKQQSEEHEIEISKEGYQTYRATHSMVGENKFRIFLTSR